VDWWEFLLQFSSPDKWEFLPQSQVWISGIFFHNLHCGLAGVFTAILQCGLVGVFITTSSDPCSGVKLAASSPVDGGVKLVAGRPRSWRHEVGGPAAAAKIFFNFLKNKTACNEVLKTFFLLFKADIKRKNQFENFFLFYHFVKLAAQRLAAKNFNVAEMLFTQ
jgi:hypothetical protein